MVDYVGRLAESRGLGMSATSTTDQRAALEGADYVVVCISTGALDSMALDVEIPTRYGIRQSVGDTVGPGGILRALRNIPVMVGIARDMEELCPDAWLLNLTNPMTTLCRAVTRTTGIETVGLCHEVTMTRFTLSMLFECDFRALDLTVTGVNHLPVVTEVDVDGRDGIAMLRELLADRAAVAGAPLPANLLAGLGHEAASFAGGEWTKGSLLDANCVKLELFERFGALPAAGDRHLVEFFPGFLTEESEWGERWGVQLTSMDDRRAWLDWYKSEFERLYADPAAEHRPSGELVAPLIESHLTDRTRSFPLNLPNAGQCPDLPDEVVVESMGTVDAKGVRGRDRAIAPPLLAEYVRRVSASQELTVDAALTGDRSTVLAAMLADPLASRVDFDRLEAMTGEMLAATARWLPQFA
jgi:alpha-galactosidase